MKVFLLLCLVGAAVALDKKQLNGLKRLLKNLDAGIFPTCNLIFFSEQVDYDTADSNCRSFRMGTDTAQDGNLATVNDADKNQDLKILLELAYPLNGSKDKWGSDKWVWAGLRKTINNGEELGAKISKKYDSEDWSWADGSHPTDFAKWFSKKQPDQAFQKNGAGQCKEEPKCLQNQMRINHAGAWDDTFKYKVHPYACDYQGKYIISATLKTWPQAKEDCEDAGLHIAKVRSLDELDEIVAAAEYFLGPRDTELREFDPTNWFWVGGSDAAEEGTWLWHDGEAVDISWMPWRSPNPDDAKRVGQTGQDSLSISKWGKFDDSYDSRRKRPFACQCPGT